MGPGHEQEFREFVRQATPGLFRVAYALTGQQQAAEDLLQAALEKVVPRWRRIDDPVAYTRRVIYHEHIGRWRRWGRRELPVATPPEVVTSADPAAAVVLRQALYGALRRLAPQQRAVLVLRYLEDCSEAEAADLLGISPKTVASQASRALPWRRTATATLASVATFTIALTGLVGGAGPETDPAGPAGTGQLVITYYLGGTPLAGYSLDPQTGEYQRDGLPASSPDLRLRLDDNHTTVIDLTDGGRRPIPWPIPASSETAVSWSPDSTRLAGTFGLARESDLPQPAVYPVFSGIQVADLASDTGRTVPLDLPSGHAATGLFWLDEHQLAVTVTRGFRTVEQPPRYEWPAGGATHQLGGGSQLVVEEVRVYAVDGTRTGLFAIDQHDYHVSQDPGLLWQVDGRVPGSGAVLLYRNPEPATLELATLDDSGITPGARVSMPDPPERHFYSPSPVLALPDGQVLVATTLQIDPTGPLAPPGRGTSQLYVATEHYLADLTTGAVRPANVPRLPDNGRPWIYADAGGLSPAAAHRAFTP